VAGFAAFASIDEMVDLTNIGTLFAFILVCAGIIVLRHKDPGRSRPFRVPSGWKWTLVLFAGWTVFVAILPFSPVTKAVLVAASALLFAVCRNHIFPTLGILSCVYLIYYLPSTSWLRFAAWLNFGFVIYVGYGAVHSRLTGRHRSERPAEHDARSAYTGAWLALIGAALLLVMRGVEIWLEALKQYENQPALARTWAAFRDVWQWPPWLEVSWFLIVPLALNAFWLAPIIIRRALRARREKGADHQVEVTRPSLIVAFGLLVATLVYFGLVAAHRLAMV
jgi:hypothetical protein